MTDTEIKNYETELKELIKQNFSEPLTVKLVTAPDGHTFIEIMWVYGNTTKLFGCHIPSNKSYSSKTILDLVKVYIVDKMNKWLETELSKNCFESEEG